MFTALFSFHLEGVHPISGLDWQQEEGSHLSPNPPRQTAGLFSALRKCPKAPWGGLTWPANGRQSFFSKLLYSSGWGINRENSNGLWMFSEVAHKELSENRPGGKISFLWASEKTKPRCLSLCPSSATTRWWHSDLKNSSANSQVKLQQNWIPTESTQHPTLVGREFMENRYEDHQCEILLSKVQRLLYTELSIYPDLLLMQNTLWRYILNSLH